MIHRHSFSPDAEAAAADPDIRAVLEASALVTESTVVIDADAFVSHLAPECVVNNPANRVVSGQTAGELMRRGLIQYDSAEVRVEYAGKHAGLVVVMGEEVVVPRGPNPLAGKTVHRRFTDVWRKVDGAWKLTVRQATITSAV